MSSNSDSPLKPVTEIVTDAVEAIVDSKLDDGIFKDIPVLGMFSKALSVVQGIREKIFLRKLGRFFESLGNFTEEEKQSFWEKHNADEKARVKLGEQIVVYLERYDNEDKAVLLARAFGAYILGKINYTDFLDLAILIDEVKIHYLSEIAVILVSAGTSWHKHLKVGSTFLGHVPFCENAGLLNRKDQIKQKEHPSYSNRKEGEHFTESKYKQTHLAEIFIEYIINEHYQDAAQKISEFYSDLNRPSSASYRATEQTQGNHPPV